MRSDRQTGAKGRNPSVFLRRGAYVMCRDLFFTLGLVSETSTVSNDVGDVQDRWNGERLEALVHVRRRVDGQGRCGSM